MAIKKNKLREGFAICVWEPRGKGGLEGYQVDEKYKFEEMENEKGIYFRVYPAALGSVNDKYYESCSRIIFNRHFEEI